MSNNFFKEGQEFNFAFTDNVNEIHSGVYQIVLPRVYIGNKENKLYLIVFGDLVLIKDNQPTDYCVQNTAISLLLGEIDDNGKVSTYYTPANGKRLLTQGMRESKTLSLALSSANILNEKKTTGFKKSFNTLYGEEEYVVSEIKHWTENPLKLFAVFRPQKNGVYENSKFYGFFVSMTEEYIDDDGVKKTHDYYTNASEYYSETPKGTAYTKALQYRFPDRNDKQQTASAVVKTAQELLDML